MVEQAKQLYKPFHFRDPDLPGSPRSDRSDRTMKVNIVELEKSIQEALSLAVREIKENEFPQLIKDAMIPYQDEISNLKQQLASITTDKDVLEEMKSDMIWFDEYSKR